MDHPKYYQDIKIQLEALLEERRKSFTKSERDLQNFFEHHPFALLSSLNGVDSSYSVVNNVIISQPNVKSLNGDRCPDFLIATNNSLNIYFNFIELEDPSKKIFRNGTFSITSEFHQANDQLKQWGSFGNNEVENYCNELLLSLYKDGYDNQVSKKRHYNYILVYGFSDEILRLTSRHNDILQENFKDKYHHCTYSRLLENYRVGTAPIFAVRKDSETNKFRAIGFTPFRTYMDEQWFDFHNIIGKEELVAKCSELAEIERTNLIDQMTIKDKMLRTQILENFKLTKGRSFSDLQFPW